MVRSIEQLFRRAQTLPRAELGRRFGWLILLTVVCLLAEENYPFSNFPMYASFARHSYYVYFADANGDAIASGSLGVSTSALKKIYERSRRDYAREKGRNVSSRSAEAKAAAGAAVLAYLEELPVFAAREARLTRGLELRHVEIRLRNGRIETTTETVARR